MEIIDLLDPEHPTFDDEYRRLANSPSPYEYQVGRMMLDLIEGLRRGPVGPRLFASHLTDELCLQYRSDRNDHAMIRVAIDRQDYSPLDNGFPQFHYRLRYDLPPPHSATNPETVDERTANVETACNVVREAIRRSKQRP